MPEKKFADVDPDELRRALKDAGIEGFRVGEPIKLIGVDVAGWLVGKPDKFVHGPVDGLWRAGLTGT